MGGGRSWFGKKERPAPEFLVGSARYTGGPGPMDPELAEYWRQQNSEAQQGQAQGENGQQAPQQVTNYNTTGVTPSSTSSGPSIDTSYQAGNGGGQTARAVHSSMGIPKDKQLYPTVDSTGKATVVQGKEASSQLYPNIGSEVDNSEPGVERYSGSSGLLGSEFDASVLAQSGVEVGSTGDKHLEAHEEELVRVPGAMVHLIGGETSLLLTVGDFRLVRITQEGNGVVAIIKVGDDMQWPLGWDEPVFKIDSNRYVFTLRFTEDMEDERPRPPSPPSPQSGQYKFLSGSSSVDGRELPGGVGAAGEDKDNTVDIMTYGVTFIEGVPPEVNTRLDACLQQYCVFSEPEIVAKEGVGATAASTSAAPPVEGAKGGGKLAVLAANSTTVNAATKLAEASVAANQEAGKGQVLAGGATGGKHLKGELKEDSQGLVVPTNSNERQLAEKNGEYWTTIAPNVSEYRTTVAKGIAAGSGGMIKGIFYMSQAATQRLEKMGSFAKGRMKAADPNNPTRISPAMMRSMRHARRMSKMTAKVADGILAGVVVTTGFVTGKILKHTLFSTAVSKVIPGEVAIVSLEAFGRVFDAVELAGKNVLQTTSVVTSGVVSHKYGGQAGELASHGLGAAGHMIHTAWTVSKVRKAFMPSKVVKSSMMKEALQGVSQAAGSHKSMPKI